MKKRKETPTQEIIRLLHKTHKEVHQILAIVSKGAITDLSKEDKLVLDQTDKVNEATKEIPSPGQ